MANSLSYLGLLYEPMKMLRDQLNKYRKKKEIIEDLVQALNSEIEAFEAIFKNIEKIWEEQTLPLLKSLDSNYSRSKIIQLIKCEIDFLIEFSKLMESFVRLARGCKDVSFCEGFMEHLKEANYRLFDFVKIMASTVKNDTILLDSKFYRFMKMYGDDLLKKEKAKDIDAAIKEGQSYVDILNRRVKPKLRRELIPKKTLKHLRDNYKKLRETSRKIKVRRTDLIDSKEYVPTKLLPLVILIEETFLSKK